MNRCIWSGLVAFLVLALTACGGETPAPTPLAANPTTSDAAGNATPGVSAEHVAAAQQFVSQLGSGDFAGAEQTFDPTMKQVMPEAKLKDTWQQLLAQVGAFQRLEGTRTTQA